MAPRISGIVLKQINSARIGIVISKNVLFLSFSCLDISFTSFLLCVSLCSFIFLYHADNISVISLPAGIKVFQERVFVLLD